MHFKRGGGGGRIGKSAADLPIFALLITSRIIIYWPNVQLQTVPPSAPPHLAYATGEKPFCNAVSKYFRCLFQFNLSQIFNQNNDASEITEMVHRAGRRERKEKRDV